MDQVIQKVSKLSLPEPHLRSYMSLDIYTADSASSSFVGASGTRTMSLGGSPLCPLIFLM